MFALLVLLVFLALPFYMGYRWANYAAFGVPVALIGLAALLHVSGQSSDGLPTDDTDVMPDILLAASVAGLVLCAWGVALGKQRQDTGS